jgi:Universal stress protein family
MHRSYFYRSIPQVAIVEYAEKNNVDLVVVGTRGMSGLNKLLLGSVALGVIKYSHCPVLVVVIILVLVNFTIDPAAAQQQQ